MQTFVDALGDAPVHTRRALFGTLVDALGEDSLAVIASVLLRRSSFMMGATKKERHLVLTRDEEPASNLVEFVHQTCHFASARSQVGGGPQDTLSCLCDRIDGLCPLCCRRQTP